MIITLSGVNSFAARHALQAIVDSYSKKYGIQGIERFDGEDFNMARLSDITQGGSLFATNRLIIIRGAAKNKQLWEALGEIVQQVPEETTIVLVEDVLDKRTRTYKQLKNDSNFREFSAPSEQELLGWIESEAIVYGGTIDRQTAKYLLAQVGTDQWRLRQEIAKLCAFDPEVNTVAIDDLVEANPEASVFDLLDFMLNKQPAKMRVLLQKLRTNEDPYKLFGLLVSQVHTLAVVAHGGTRNPDEIAKSAGIHPYVVRKMGSLAKRTTKAELQKIIHQVADTDHKLKSSGHDPWLLLEQALNKIATRL